MLIWSWALQFFLSQRSSALISAYLLLAHPICLCLTSFLHISRMSKLRSNTHVSCGQVLLKRNENAAMNTSWYDTTEQHTSGGQQSTCYPNCCLMRIPKCCIEKRKLINGTCVHCFSTLTIKSEPFKNLGPFDMIFSTLLMCHFFY